VDAFAALAAVRHRAIGLPNPRCLPGPAGRDNILSANLHHRLDLTGRPGRGSGEMTKSFLIGIPRSLASARESSR
jgi:hypothetical protein